MNQNDSIQKQSHPMRAFLGFFITFISIFILIANGLFLCVKCTVLKGKNINEILDNSGIYTAIYEAAVNELHDIPAMAGVSGDAIDSLFPAETISDTAKIITDAFVYDKDVDFSHLKDDCMKIAVNTADSVVDSAFEAFENTDKSFDVKTLTQSPKILEFEKNYGIHVSGAIENKITEKMGSTAIDLSKIDSKEVKNTVSTALSETVYPVIDKAFDNYISTANDYFNKSADTLNNEYNIGKIFRAIEHYLRLFTLGIIILYVFAALLFVTELLLYKSCPHRAFRNFSISALLSSLPVLICGLGLKLTIQIITDRLTGAGGAEEAVGKFINTNVSYLGNAAIITGIVYIIIFIILMSLSSVLKKKSQHV